jgi:hypothetical protein
MAQRCPTPTKVAHPTETAAKRHAGGLYAKEGKVALVHPYKCKCGAWHIGGRRKKFGRRRVQR